MNEWKGTAEDWAKDPSQWPHEVWLAQGRRMAADLRGLVANNPETPNALQWLEWATDIEARVAAGAQPR